MTNKVDLLLAKLEGYMQAVGPLLADTSQALNKVEADLKACPERRIELTISLRWPRRCADRAGKVEGR